MFGTQLIWKGLVIGRVMKLGDPVPTAEKPFLIEAALDKPYAKWTFSKAEVVPGIISNDYLTPSTIELTYSGEATAMPQTLELTTPKSGSDNTQDMVTSVIDSLELKPLVNALAELGKSLDESERLRRRIDENKANPLERTMGNALEITGNINTAVTKLEKSSLELIGETPAQRRAMRAEILGTLNNLKAATASLNDLLQRVGDTGMGRMIIRKKETEENRDRARR